MDNSIQDEFAKRFKDFIYPFITADMAIAKMTPAKRVKYYREAMKIKRNEVLIQELNETCRYLYFKLAVETKSEEERTLYRGALMFATIFKGRINNLAMRDEIEISKQLEKTNQRIDEIIE